MAKKYYPDIGTVCEEIRQFLVLMSCTQAEADRVGQMLAEDIDDTLWSDADDGEGYLVDLEGADLEELLELAREEYDATSEYDLRNTSRHQRGH